MKQFPPSSFDHLILDFVTLMCILSAAKVLSTPDIYIQLAPGPGKAYIFTVTVSLVHHCCEMYTVTWIGKFLVELQLKVMEFSAAENTHEVIGTLP